MVGIAKGKSIFWLMIVIFILMETVILLSSFIGEKALIYTSLLLILIEFLFIFRYRFDLLVYSCFLVFLLSQFLLPIFDIGRWLALLIVSGISLIVLKRSRFKISPIVVGLGLLACYSMLTAVISYYPAISFLKGISLLLLSFFLATVIPAVQVTHPNADVREYFLKMFLTFAIIIILSNVVFVVVMPTRSFLADRFRGWFTNPNGIGASYGMFLLPVLAYKWVKCKPQAAKFALLVVLIIGVIELLLSRSRAGILCGFTSLGVFFLTQRNLHGRFGWILTSILILGIVIASNPSNNLLRQFIYRNEDTLLGSGRLPVWINTWNRFLQHSIWGSGLGVSDTGLQSLGVVFTTLGYSIEKGNSYLGILEELGTVGSLIFVGFLILPLLKISCRNFITSNKTEASQVLISIMVAGLVNGLFEAWMLSAGSILCFAYWLLATLLFTTDGYISNS
jgi:O-antigen ligase